MTTRVDIYVNAGQINNVDVIKGGHFAATLKPGDSWFWYLWNGEDIILREHKEATCPPETPSATD